MNITDTSLFLGIILLCSLLTDCIPNRECNRIRIEENWYNKEVLWSDGGIPFNLNIHKSSNSLIFTFSKIQSYADANVQLGYYNIDTKDYLVIAGIQDGCANAIDQHNDDIYLGGSDGIYKFNMVTKIADFHREKGTNIWGLYFKRNLFYIRYPEQRLFMEVDEKFAKVKEFDGIQIDYFHISDNDIIYSNKTGLYKYDSESSNAVTINDLLTVRQINEDLDGNVYICSNIGVFTYKDGVLRKVLDMKTIHGIAFDKDNVMVLSDEKRIFKLVQSNVGCIVDDEKW